MGDIEYQLSGPSLKEVEQTVDKLWEGLTTDPQSLRRAKEAKINLNRLPPGRRNRFIKLRRKGSGIDPLSTVIGVSITLGAKVVKDVWNHVLLPRLRKQYGDRSLKETEAPKKKNTTKKKR